MDLANSADGNAGAAEPVLDAGRIDTLLAVTRRLAAPVALSTMLHEVTLAACEVLRAERASVWLLDAAAGQLVLTVSDDMSALRIPLSVGLSGASARERQLVDVPDCYADPRFDASVDRRSGFHTRNSLSLPLDDLDGRLVGVLQVLNRPQEAVGADHPLAQALAAQCAVALARAQGLERLRETERLHRDLALARRMQASALPRRLPAPDGYRLHAVFQPAEQTGGDIYDVVPHQGQVLLVLADAAGHGIGPALSVVQLQAMLRFGLRSGGSLAGVFRHVNDELCERLPDGHFITAFVGLLDPASHGVSFVSGGQGPILHHVAADGRCVRHRATVFPMGAMPLAAEPVPVTLDMAPGDWLVLASDGIFEQTSPEGEIFGRERVERLVAESALTSPEELAARLLRALASHGAGRQDDDVTLVLLQRLP